MKFNLLILRIICRFFYMFYKISKFRKLLDYFVWIKFFFLLFFIRVIIIVIVLCDFYFYGDDCLKNCLRYVNGSYGRCNVMG